MTRRLNESPGTTDAMKDFFISYTSADRDWAEWIGLALTDAGRTVVIQAWDFLPGSNFVLNMQNATVECNRTIAVLSPDWLASVFTQPEWAVAFSLDPTGATRKLIPVRVRVCEPPGLLRTIVYCDLVGRDEKNARKALLDGVGDAKERPTSIPFPAAHSSIPAASSPTTEYPGAHITSPLAQLPSLLQATLSLLSLLRTTRTTFVAQATLRDRLIFHLQERLVLNPFAHWEYEEFIASHYKDFDEDERRMFSTMRSFTVNILSEYNRRILKFIEDNPFLTARFAAVSDLRDHLLVWLAKYEGTFVRTPVMCLLYTGVNEGVPFPSHLEGELWKFLQQSPEANAVLQAEPDSPLATEEHSSSWRSWEGDKRLFQRWERRRFPEITQERKNLEEAASRIGASETRERLRALDAEEATLIDFEVYPQINWRPIAIPERLLNSLRALLDEMGNSKWSPEFTVALNEAAPAARNPSPGGFDVKGLIVQLPIISYFVGSLGIQSDLPAEWAGFRDQLKEWVLAGMKTGP
jgi:hypothetical protein